MTGPAVFSFLNALQANPSGFTQEFLSAAENSGVALAEPEAFAGLTEALDYYGAASRYGLDPSHRRLLLDEIARRIEAASNDVAQVLGEMLNMKGQRVVPFSPPKAARDMAIRAFFGTDRGSDLSLELGAGGTAAAGAARRPAERRGIRAASGEGDELDRAVQDFFSGTLAFRDVSAARNEIIRYVAGLRQDSLLLVDLAEFIEKGLSRANATQVPKALRLLGDIIAWMEPYERRMEWAYEALLPYLIHGDNTIRLAAKDALIRVDDSLDVFDKGLQQRGRKGILVEIGKALTVDLVAVPEDIRGKVRLVIAGSLFADGDRSISSDTKQGIDNATMGVALLLGESTIERVLRRQAGGHADAVGLLGRLVERLEMASLDSASRSELIRGVLIPEIVDDVNPLNNKVRNEAIEALASIYGTLDVSDRDAVRQALEGLREHRVEAVRNAADRAIAIIDAIDAGR